MEAVGRGQLHHLLLPRGQYPLNACLSSPASPRAHGLCPTLTHLVVLTCQHTKEQTHCTHLIGGMKAVCEKVRRERETRRPNRDRHTKALNPHTRTLRETWAGTGRENHGDDWVPDSQAGARKTGAGAPGDSEKRRGSYTCHISSVLPVICVSFPLVSWQRAWGGARRGEEGPHPPTPRNAGDHR